jgi:hypothetical protein
MGAGERTATPVLLDRDLPHEERPGLFGAVEAGHEAADLTAGPGDHGGRREVTAPEHIAVRRIEVEGL